MQLYTFAALTILAITMGQIPQTRAGLVKPITSVAGAVTTPVKVLLGGNQLSPNTDVVTIMDSLGNIVGHLKGPIVSFVRNINPQPGNILTIHAVDGDDVAEVHKELYGGGDDHDEDHDHDDDDADDDDHDDDHDHDDDDADDDDHDHDHDDDDDDDHDDDHDDDTDDDDHDHDHDDDDDDDHDDDHDDDTDDDDHDHDDGDGYYVLLHEDAPSHDDITDLALQLGGEITLGLNKLGRVVNGTQAVVDWKGHVIDQLTQNSIQPSVFDIIVMGSSVLALPKNVMGLALLLEHMSDITIGPDHLAELNSANLRLLLNGANNSSLPKLKLHSPVVMVTDKADVILAFLAGGKIINVVEKLFKLYGSRVHLVPDSANDGTVKLLNAEENVRAKISGAAGLTLLINQMGGQLNLEQMSVTDGRRDGHVLATSKYTMAKENISESKMTFIDGKQSIVFGSDVIGAWLVNALLDSTLVPVKELTAANTGYHTLKSVSNRARAI